jgi:YbbR domain-containing protein
MKINFNLSKFLDNNNFVVVLSVIIAIGLWLVVTLSINPETTRTIKGLPVAINTQNTALQKLGLEVIGGIDQKITVIVKGTRYKVGGLSAENFDVNISTVGVTQPGEYDLDITVSKKIEESNYEIVSFYPKKIKLNFDRLTTKEIAVEPETSGIKVGEGFILEKPYSNPEKIVISGPEAKIEKIARCIAKATSKTTLTETLITDGEIELYDKDNKKIEFDDLKISKKKVEITVPVFKTKTLPLKFEYINIPKDFDVSILKPLISEKEITVAASTEAVNNLGEISVGFVDFRKIDIGSAFTFDVSLPAGYINVKNLDKVTVEFKLDGFMSSNQTVSNIVPVNLPSGFDIKVITQKISNVKIVGLKSEIESLTPSDIISQIDLETLELDKGQKTVAVKISFPNKKSCWVVGEYSAIISAIKK